MLSSNFLKLVEIKTEAFDPDFQYADIYRQGQAVRILKNRPFVFSPSRLFNREGKSARRFKRRMDLEKTERKIDERFNERAVKALTPLKGAELDYFMVLYRPTLKKLEKMDSEDFKFYLMNSYKEFMSLPAEKRVSPALH